MRTKEIVNKNASYESPMINLMEFEVELGFAATNKMSSAGFNGSIQETGTTHSY